VIDVRPALATVPLVLFAALVVAAPALGHDGGAASIGSSGTSPGDIVVALALLCSLAAYAAGVVRLWRASGVGHGVTRADALRFAGGWLALAIALASPLHALGQVLFSAHMGQHEILMLVAAPLLVLGRPGIAYVWAMPAPVRRRWQGVVHLPRARRAWQTLTIPAVAWSLQAIALWTWHVPALFEATLHSELAHAAQHASFLLSAVLFWWALVHRGRGATGYGVAILALFSTSLHSGLLGALLTFATTLWYPSYAATAPAWGLSPLEDQQLGGLLMWVPAGLLYLGAALALFAGWLREAERASVRRTPAWPVALLACVVLGALLLPGCGGEDTRQASAATGGGAPERGRELLRGYGCQTCHIIPGVMGARGRVGPTLDGFAGRAYVAGMLPNSAENVARWVEDPTGVNPHTAMPNVGVDGIDARDIAAYLMTLR
jgi:putative membrane protein